MARRYSTLDGMRGVAAVAVLLGHAQQWIAPVSMPKTWLAVDLFFILSGFVLSRIYEPRFADGMTTRQFMTERYVRLYPLAFMGFAIGIASGGVALLLHKGDFPPLQFVLSALSGIALLPSPTGHFNPEVMPMNVPAWSLFFEIVVNLAFILIWKYLSRTVLSIIILVSASALVYYYFMGQGFGGPTWPSFGWGFPRVFFGFFVGVYLGRYFRYDMIETGWAWAVPLVLVVLLFYHPPASPTVDILLVLFGFPVLVVAGSILEPARIRLFAVCGAISYPMYAIHSPLLNLMIRLMIVAHFRPERFAPLTGFAFAAGIALIAYWLDIHYDQPVRAWLKAKVGSLRKGES